MPEMYCCAREMRCKRNSVRVVLQDEAGHPWRITSADLWTCRTCGRDVVAGLARSAVAELGRDSREEFDRWLAADEGLDIIIPSP